MQRFDLTIPTENQPTTQPNAYSQAESANVNLSENSSQLSVVDKYYKAVIEFKILLIMYQRLNASNIRINLSKTSDNLKSRFTNLSLKNTNLNLENSFNQDINSTEFQIPFLKDQNSEYYDELITQFSILHKEFFKLIYHHAKPDHQEIGDTHAALKAAHELAKQEKVEDLRYTKTLQTFSFELNQTFSINDSLSAGKMTELWIQLVIKKIVFTECLIRIKTDVQARFSQIQNTETTIPHPQIIEIDDEKEVGKVVNMIDLTENEIVTEQTNQTDADLKENTQVDYMREIQNLNLELPRETQEQGPITHTEIVNYATNTLLKKLEEIFTAMQQSGKAIDKTFVSDLKHSAANNLRNFKARSKQPYPDPSFFKLMNTRVDQDPESQRAKQKQPEIDLFIKKSEELVNQLLTNEGKGLLFRNEQMEESLPESKRKYYMRPGQVLKNGRLGNSFYSNKTSGCLTDKYLESILAEEKKQIAKRDAKQSTDSTTETSRLNNSGPTKKQRSSHFLFQDLGKIIDLNNEEFRPLRNFALAKICKQFDKNVQSATNSFKQSIEIKQKINDIKIEAANLKNCLAVKLKVNTHCELNDRNKIVITFQSEADFNKFAAWRAEVKVTEEKNKSNPGTRNRS